MYTECPSCHTFFKVTPPQLKVAQGRVRCGRCDTVFNALATLAEEVPSTASAPASISNEFENLDMQSQFNQDQSASLADVKIPGMDVSEAVDGGLELLENDVLANLGDDIGDIAPVETQALEDNAPAGEFDLDEDLFSSPALDENAMGEMVGEGNALDLDAGDGFGELDLAGDLDEQPAADALDEFGISQFDLDDQEPSFEQDVFAADGGESVSKKASRFEAQDTEALDLNEEVPVDLASAPDLEDAPLDQPLMPDADIEVDTPASRRDYESRFETDFDEKQSAEDYVLQELDEKESKPRSFLASVFWIFLITSLLFVLLGQFAYFKREELVKNPQLRPYIEKLCAEINVYIPCEIPAPKDLEAIQLLERDVRTHPSTKGALLITSTIISKAEFEQAFPKLELTFSDINQKVLARRLFEPNEYLSDDVDLEKGLTPDLPVRIMLEIVDPGSEAVNFEFTFK